MSSDEVLIQAGSRESFEELFSRYREPVYAFFRRRLESREAAEDLAQEVWIAVMKGAERYEPRAPFRSYLYGIAFRLLAGERRRIAKANATGVTSISIASDENGESEQWVREAVGKLDQTEREMIMLREYEQLSYEEIAELLHIPINTVRSRLFRARVAIRRNLEPSSVSVIAQGRL